MMFGRQFGSNGGGADVASGATVMPLKKRKWDKRGSIEASSRQSLEMSRARPMGPTGLSHRRSSGNFASNRASMEQASRSSIEIRASMDQRRSIEFCTLPEEQIGEAVDNAEMGTIRENSDEDIIDLDEAGQAEPEVTQKVDAGHLLAKLFSIGARNKPTCMKIKGNDAEGFVVNKRFIDVVNLRESKQKAEMERLRQENLALRNANQTLSQKAMASQQQNVQYAYPGVAPTMAYAQPVMHSSLYATQPQQYAYATGPAWQYAPAP